MNVISEPPQFVLGKTNKTPEFLAKFPLGKVSMMGLVMVNVMKLVFQRCLHLSLQTGQLYTRVTPLLIIVSYFFLLNNLVTNSVIFWCL